MAGRIRIGPRTQKIVFLAEWREKRGLSQKALGERLEPVVTDMTVSRWERWCRGERGRDVSQPSVGVMAAVAEALDIQPEDLYRHPEQPSADELLRGHPAELRDDALAMIAALVQSRGRR